MKKYILPVLGTILIAFGYFCLQIHESHSSEEIEFIMEKPYLQVIKGLATKNSLEKIVEDSDGVVTNKNWENFNVEIPQRILRIRDYKIEGTMTFTVEKKDKELGELRLPFIQKINLDKEIFSLKTNLTSPQPQILAYEKIVEISPSLEDALPKTHVSAKSELKIRKTIPFFFKEYMDKKVAETNRRDLEQLKSNIMKISNQKSVVTFQRTSNPR